MGAGKGRKNPFHPRNQGAQSQRQQRGNDVWTGTVADRYSAWTLHGHPNGARPKNGMQSRREYTLLVPEELAGDPATAGTQVIEDGHGATSWEDD